MSQNIPSINFLRCVCWKSCSVPFPCLSAICTSCHHSFLLPFSFLQFLFLLSPLGSYLCGSNSILNFPLQYIPLSCKAKCRSHAPVHLLSHGKTSLLLITSPGFSLAFHTSPLIYDPLNNFVTSCLLHSCFVSWESASFLPWSPWNLWTHHDMLSSAAGYAKHLDPPDSLSASCFFSHTPQSVISSFSSYILPSPVFPPPSPMWLLIFPSWYSCYPLPTQVLPLWFAFAWKQELLLSSSC